MDFLTAVERLWVVVVTVAGLGEEGRRLRRVFDVNSITHIVGCSFSIRFPKPASSLSDLSIMGKSWLNEDYI